MRTIPTVAEHRAYLLVDKVAASDPLGETCYTVEVENAHGTVFYTAVHLVNHDSPEECLIGLRYAATMERE